MFKRNQPEICKEKASDYKLGPFNLEKNEWHSFSFNWCFELRYIVREAWALLYKGFSYVYKSEMIESKCIDPLRALLNLLVFPLPFKLIL